MDKGEYLERIHKEIMLVMDEMDRVCKENNLRYYMIGGTLLGAVRHKGFIPWDDDLDIVMPREDFKRFIALAGDKLRYPFKLSWITTREDYWLMFAKVYNSETLFECETMPKRGEPFGIYIDIFPIDTTKGYSQIVELRSKMIFKIKVMLSYNAFYSERRNMKTMLSHCFSNAFLQKITNIIMTCDSRGDYFTNFGSQYNAHRQTIKKDCFGEGVALPFEDRKYIAPLKYHEVLTSIFGKNYMELPPVNERRIHYPQKVIFSDGSLAEFKYIGEKVRAKRDL